MNSRQNRRRIMMTTRHTIKFPSDTMVLPKLNMTQGSSLESTPNAKQIPNLKRRNLKTKTRVKMRLMSPDISDSKKMT